MDDVRRRMEGICRGHPNGPRMPNDTTILEMISRSVSCRLLPYRSLPVPTGPYRAPSRGRRSALGVGFVFSWRAESDWCES